MTSTPLFADISTNNAFFHASEYRDTGHLVVAIKATEGTSYVNPEHRPWCNEAGAERLTVIHYHFARPDLGDSPDSEARHFLEVALPLAGGRDFMAVDIERATPQGWVHDPAWSRGFDEYVQAHSRFHTILYASRSVLQANPDQWLAGDLKRVWDADWSGAPDFAPSGYTCAIRQQSGVTAGKPPYSLPGVGPCDVNVARGAFWSTIQQNAR
jgi:hypothetical protein